MQRLERAESNVPERGNGSEIYSREVVPARLDLSRVAAHYAVLSLFDTFDVDAHIYCYSVTRRDLEIHKAGRARLAVGSIEVRSIITHETASFEFAALHLGDTELAGGVRAASADYDEVRGALTEAMEPGAIPKVFRLLDTHFGAMPISIRSLFRDEQRRVLHELIVATLDEAESTFRQLHERYDPLMRFHNRLGIPVPKVLRMAAEFDLNQQIRRLLERDLAPAAIEALLREARDEGVTLDETTLVAFGTAIERASERFRERPDDLDRLEDFDAVVSLIRDARLDVELRRAQNRYYRLRSTLRPAIEASATAVPASREWLELFDHLGEKLSIAAGEGRGRP
jgi:hypothetical protein